MNKKCLLKDVNGNWIGDGDKFKFKLVRMPIVEDLELIGTFTWSQKKLRYNINIEESSNEVKWILYDTNRSSMYDFKLIKE